MSTIIIAPLGGSPLYVAAVAIFGFREAFIYSLIPILWLTTEAMIKIFGPTFFISAFLLFSIKIFAFSRLSELPAHSGTERSQLPQYFPKYDRDQEKLLHSGREIWYGQLPQKPLAKSRT